MEELEAHPHIKKSCRDAKASSLQCLGKLQEIQNAIASTCNVLADNKYAKQIIQDLRKGNTLLEKQRKVVQSLSTAKELDPVAIKTSITEALALCKSNIDNLKNAHRFMPST
eukprot:2359903-Lingulodinium_polyedra.AAC.1